MHNNYLLVACCRAVMETPKTFTFISNLEEFFAEEFCMPFLSSLDLHFL